MDSNVERKGDEPYGPGMEARVSRLENGMQEVVAAVGRIESAMAEVKRTVDDLRVVAARIETQLPYLATKADLAGKPSKSYMWGILAVLLTAYACGLAGLAVLK